MNTPACLTFAVSPLADPSGSGPLRFRGVAYSGGVIPQYGFYGDACIDLASLSLPAGELFALVDHEPAKRAGKFSARIEANSIIVEGGLFAATEAGREVAALMREGAPWQMSVGIQADAEQSDKRRKVACNGRDIEVHTVFRNAALREVSFVPVGADPNTTVAAFARNLLRSAPMPSPQPSPSGGGGDGSPLPLGAGAGVRTVSPVNQPGVPDMTLEELQSQVAELSAKLEAETAARQSAEQALAAVQLAARKASIATLAADLGRDLKPEESAVLEGLADPAYATLSATLLSFKPAKAPADPSLFQDLAIDGKAPDTKLDLAAQIISKMQP